MDMLEIMEEGRSDTSLSSVPSMGRQMTEQSEIRCIDVMSRQCSAFRNRDGEFWMRQNTAPAASQRAACLTGMKRQLSCPQPAQEQFAAEVDAFAPGADPGRWRLRVHQRLGGRAAV